jgi:hypothetical protein
MFKNWFGSNEKKIEDEISELKSEVSELKLELKRQQGVIEELFGMVNDLIENHKQLKGELCIQQSLRPQTPPSNLEHEIIMEEQVQLDEHSIQQSLSPQTPPSNLEHEIIIEQQVQLEEDVIVAPQSVEVNAELIEPKSKKKRQQKK